MDYHIKKGGHKDMYRIYPMMKFDFSYAELVAQPYLQCALMKGAVELLLLKNENGLEIGYAVMYKNSLYDYVLLSYLAIYPTFRGNGAGTRFLEFIRERYEDTQGIFLEVTYSDTAERRHRLYASQGYEDVTCAYKIGGVDTTLMCLRLNGSPDPSPAAPLIVRDLYSGVLPQRVFNRVMKVGTI